MKRVASDIRLFVLRLLPLNAYGPKSRDDERCAKRDWRWYKQGVKTGRKTSRSRSKEERKREKKNPLKIRQREPREQCRERCEVVCRVQNGLVYGEK